MYDLFINPIVQISRQCMSASSVRGNGDKTSVIALVLARGGSKGVRLKNLREVGGITLLGRSLQAIRQSGAFAEVWVSTDHEGIASEAERCAFRMLLA